MYRRVFTWTLSCVLQDRYQKCVFSSNNLHYFENKDTVQKTTLFVGQVKLHLNMNIELKCIGKMAKNCVVWSNNVKLKSSILECVQYVFSSGSRCYDK